MEGFKELDNLGFDTAREAMAAVRQDGRDWIRNWDVDPSRSAAEAKAIEAINQQLTREGPKPTLYKASISQDAIDRMIDWDKPLSQQTPAVKNLLESSREFKDGLALTGKSATNDPTGEGIYRAIEDYFSQAERTGVLKDPENASKHLDSIGIKGIKYLDQNSRAAGEGTRNYVVFDDKLPQIQGRGPTPEEATANARTAIAANRARSVLDGDGMPPRTEPKVAATTESANPELTARLQDAQARMTEATQQADSARAELQRRLTAPGEPAPEPKPAPEIIAADKEVARAEAQAKAYRDVANCQRLA
jgi:hypothetical protein